jgi:hypothetical protein
METQIVTGLERFAPKFVAAPPNGYCLIWPDGFNGISPGYNLAKPIPGNKIAGNHPKSE